MGLSYESKCWVFRKDHNNEMRVIEKCILRHMKEHSNSKHKKGIRETSIEDKMIK